MNKILSCGAALLMFAGLAQADVTLPSFDMLGVYDEVSGVNLNGASIPVENYTSYSVSFDWANISGAYSNEALFALTSEVPLTASTVFYADPGSNMPGSAGSSDPTTLSISGFFDVPYVGGDPLWFAALQSWEDSSADWTNIQVTLGTDIAVAPTAVSVAAPSQTDGVLTEGAIDWYTFTLTEETEISINTALSTGIIDSELALYDASGNVLATNDDISYPDNTLSEIAGTAQAGTYYVAVGAYNSTFGGGFNAVGGDADFGAYTLQITPEPASMALLALGALACIRRRS